MPALELKLTPQGWETWDAGQIFRAGNAAYDEGEWDEAIAYYDRLIRVFTDDPLVPSALFNGGLALESAGRVEAAEQYFAALIDRFPDHALAVNAYWNLIDLRERREAWRDVLRAAQALRSYAIDSPARFELDARMVIAETMIEPTDANLDRLEAAAAEYGRRLREGQGLPRDVFARLFWTIGEVYLSRSQAVPIRPDGASLEQDMERKAALLLKAQDGYMRTIRALNPYWATAAVYRIGLAYESFYADLVEAPTPAGLADDERREYLIEVRAALEPVKLKAEAAYERIIQFGKKYSLDTQWVRSAEDRLSRLKNLKLPDPGPSVGG